MDPINAFLSLSTDLKKLAVDDLYQRQQRELQMWKTWKEGGMQPDHLKPLIQSFKNLISSQANIWAGRVRVVPPAAIKIEFTNQCVKAIATYDPNKGAGLGTHIRHQLRRAPKFITTYQNPGRIPETRVYLIQNFKNAEERLTEDFGRPPTQLELADHLKWPPKQVDVLQREIRKAKPISQFKSDPMSQTLSRHNEIMRLLPYELGPDEKQVFEYVYGIGGKPKLEPGQIAQKLAMSSSKVSRIKKSIAIKYSKYSEE